MATDPNIATDYDSQIFEQPAVLLVNNQISAF